MVLVSACNEDVTGGACPALCPEQNVTMIDTIINAVVIDSTIDDVPALGSEARLTLLRQGDSLETAIVVRYDTLVSSFVRSGTDTTRLPVVDVDSARMVLILDGNVGASAPVTFDVFEVDPGPSGADTASVNATVRTGTPITSLTIPADTAISQLSIPLPSAPLAARVTAHQPFIVAITARSDSAVTASFISREGLNSPQLFYKAVVTDTDRRQVFVLASDTAQGRPTEEGELADFTSVVHGSPAPPADVVAVGGLPSSRIYYSFDLPPRILDSTTVVRASLLVTQQRASGPGSTARLPIHFRQVGVGPTVEPGKAVLLPSALPAVAPDTLVPADSGRVRLEMVDIVRGWAGTDSTKLQHAIVITSDFETISPSRILFFSNEADPSVRPRLQVTFVPNTSAGLP
ncbi:MAG TPA: hypothetical protein VFK13_00600 [Gemmatimonadaceae bacterium]|nr:hypothetical protein [Gemmatimonadaceae bacterium]